MTDFALTLIESLLSRIIKVRGDGPFTRAAIRSIREDLEQHPELVPDAIDEALEKHNLALQPKGQTTMARPAPYISDPFSPLLTVAAYVRGQGDRLEAIHAGIGLADYGAMSFIPEGVAGPSPVAVAAMSIADCEQYVKDCCPEAAGVAANAIDWKSLAAIVLKLVLSWLGS